MKTAKFSFFLRNKKNVANQWPIVLSITVNNDRTQLFTGLYTDKQKWNAKAKRIKGNDLVAKSINDSLLTILSQARQVSNELLMSGLPFNPNTIKDKIRNGFKKNLGTVESFELFLLRIKSLIPSKYTNATLVKYTNTKERVKEFIKVYRKRNDIYLYELDTEFMESFDVWLRQAYKVSHNTVYKTYQRFTRFIRQEIARGNLDKYPFPDYNLKMQVKQGHYLSYEDIQKIENLEIDLPRLNQVKHLFLFCCYTGLAFIDLENAKETDLVRDENGMCWIKTFRQKSKSRVSVPLISRAVKSLEILRSEKFERKEGKLLPVKSNVHLNYEIKQVATLANIQNPELVTWHTARRSTSSLLMKAGIPLQVLQKILSHKSLNTSLMYYSHTDDEMVGKAMAELEKKLNQNKKINK